MIRVFKVLLFAEFAALLGADSGFLIHTYPGTGSTFTVKVITITYVGRIGFMTTEDNSTIGKSNLSIVLFNF